MVQSARPAVLQSHRCAGKFPVHSMSSSWSAATIRCHPQLKCMNCSMSTQIAAAPSSAALPPASAPNLATFQARCSFSLVTDRLTACRPYAAAAFGLIAGTRLLRTASLTSRTSHAGLRTEDEQNAYRMLGWTCRCCAASGALRQQMESRKTRHLPHNRVGNTKIRIQGTHQQLIRGQGTHEAQA